MFVTNCTAAIRMVSDFLGTVNVPNGWIYTIQEEICPSCGHIIRVAFSYKVRNLQVSFVLLHDEEVKGVCGYMVEDVLYRIGQWGTICSSPNICPNVPDGAFCS